MNRPASLIYNIDWFTILLYGVLVFLGWINIYATVYDDGHNNIFDFSQRYGKQIVWIGAAFLLGFLLLLTDSKFFTTFSFVIYGIMMALLVAVLLFGKEVNGSRSWFELGGIRLQPAEFAKFATALAVANLMSSHGFKMMRLSDILRVGLVLLLPVALILLQNDTGSALVYSAFILVMYRENLHGSILLLFMLVIVLFIFTLLYSPSVVLLIIIAGSSAAFLYYRQNKKELFRILLVLLLSYGTLMIVNELVADIEPYYCLLAAYLVTTIFGIFYIYKRKMRYIGLVLLVSWLCIGATITVDYVFDHLKPHQQERILSLVGKEKDLYNVQQSKIAIGSGGLSGKGFLQGTQTKLNFVPEQSTDFIFCTVGEEWGFIGSLFVISLFAALILRIIFLAERQRSVFSRVYGYCVASILFFHVAVNIGMTIGVAPVIGIPLPLFSYGGSSLWAFTLLIFIFIRLDANRLQVFR